MHLARQTWCAAGAMGCGDGLCRRAAVPRRPRTRACVRRQCVRVVTVEVVMVEVGGGNEGGAAGESARAFSESSSLAPGRVTHLA